MAGCKTRRRTVTPSSVHVRTTRNYHGRIHHGAARRGSASSVSEATPGHGDLQTCSERRSWCAYHPQMRHTVAGLVGRKGLRAVGAINLVGSPAGPCFNGRASSCCGSPLPGRPGWVATEALALSDRICTRRLVCHRITPLTPAGRRSAFE